MEIKHIEFKELRLAYSTVKQFIKRESPKGVKQLDNKLVEDLRLAGGDNDQFLSKFVTKFELGTNGFDYKLHFHTETELYDSSAAFLNLLSFFVWLPLKTIELLSFRKVRFNCPDLVTPDRKVKDLSFRDMVTWYIEKEYRLGSEIRYVLKSQAAITK